MRMTVFHLRPEAIIDGKESSVNKSCVVNRKVNRRAGGEA